MTVLHECDRCRRVMNDDDYFTVSMVSNYRAYPLEHVYHYCRFCATIAINAITIVNHGVYGGSLDAEDKIGKYPPGRETFDPLLKKGEKDDRGCAGMDGMPLS